VLPDDLLLVCVFSPLHCLWCDEESEAETKEEDGSEDGLVTERKGPVPRWEVLAEIEQLCKQLRLKAGALG
jgi:hypothetical protein